MEVAEQLHKRRTAAGLSIRQLAELSGVSKSMIWKLEAGKQYMMPSVRTIEKLADALGCSVTDLLGESALEVKPSPNRDAVILDLIKAVDSHEMSVKEAIDTLTALGVVSRVPREANAGGDMATAV